MRRPLTSRLFPYTTLFRSSDTTIAGRHPNCEIFLDDVTVSRKHAAFVRDGDGFRVRDLGSLNGTYIGKERVDEMRLQYGQDVQIGKYRQIGRASCRESEQARGARSPQ